MANASISGSGTIGGGQYEKVTISGSGKVSGNLQASEFKISGSGKVEGNVQVGHCKISGSGSVEGSLKGTVFKVSGSAKVKGAMELTELIVKGSFKCESSIKSNCILSSGSLKALGDVETESFTSDGNFHVVGLLNANEINVKLRNRSFSKEIGGETIKIIKSDSSRESGVLKKLMIWLLGSGNGTLTTDLIEGTNVYAEETKAKIIRGDNVEIGPNCHVESVEYSNSINIDPTSVVLNQNMI